MVVANHRVQPAVSIQGQRRPVVVVDALAKRLRLAQRCRAVGDEITDTEANLGAVALLDGCIYPTDKQLPPRAPELGAESVADSPIGTPFGQQERIQGGDRELQPGATTGCSTSTKLSKGRENSSSLPSFANTSSRK